MVASCPRTKRPRNSHRHGSDDQHWNSLVGEDTQKLVEVRSRMIKVEKPAIVLSQFDNDNLVCRARLQVEAAIRFRQPPDRLLSVYPTSTIVTWCPSAFSADLSLAANASAGLLFRGRDVAVAEGYDCRRCILGIHVAGQPQHCGKCGKATNETSRAFVMVHLPAGLFGGYPGLSLRARDGSQQHILTTAWATEGGRAVLMLWLIKRHAMS
jgi:hypothetical protein